jgi:transcriptional regulator with PAS, ATPase and Fis domain
VGGQSAIPVNVRVIAASNRSPEEAVAEGKLRRDLYYRLNVVQICIRPLRDRIEDLEDLAPHLIREINSDEGKEVEGSMRNALQRCGVIRGREAYVSCETRSIKA